MPGDDNFLSQNGAAVEGNAKQATRGSIRGMYWGYMGIMEKEMETTIMGFIGLRIMVPLK